MINDEIGSKIAVKQFENKDGVQVVNGQALHSC